MKKLIHKIICIKTDRVIRVWNEPEDSLLIKSLYLFGIRVCDVETRKATKREFMRSLNTH